MSYKIVRDTDKGYCQGTGKLIILINPCIFPTILLTPLRVYNPQMNCSFVVVYVLSCRQ